jgi:butyryl-CoA dehydrogenase
VTSKIVSRRDLDFLLYEVLEAEALTKRERYADHSRETFDAAIDSALKLAERYFATHNHKADANEPRFENGRVETIPEVKEALSAFSEAGFMAAGQDFANGGMQLPTTITQTCYGIFKGANVSTAGYSFLTIAAANLIRAHGSEEQKARWLPPLFEGRFFGTMALTEPQAGSSLSDIKTAAEPAGDGTYRLTGNKIFISGGDQEISENIVHMVLARIRGAPPGVKGISLFIVPKYLVNEDGSRGERNDVTLAGLIHKMGYRGTTSTMLNFGENGRCVGYLVGEPHRGLPQMFHMMNEARIGVGLGAVMLGYTGYLHSLDYARGRPQGRHAQGKDPTSPQLPIIQHADVKRMLLVQKAFVEGGLALCLYAARLVDDQKTSPDAQVREEARQLLEILTPMVKAWPSQFCLEANYHAIQIHGGYGYTREYPVEQFYRDNRLNPIHEGTNGIQGLDLLGRKAAMNDGAAFSLLMREIGGTIQQARNAPLSDLRSFAGDLEETAGLMSETTRTLVDAMRQDANRALANASIYLEALGHTVVAWMWLRQALAAVGKDGMPAGDADFYSGKLAACRYFFRYELPKVRQQAELLKSLDATTLEMAEGWF